MSRDIQPRATSLSEPLTARDRLDWLKLQACYGRATTIQRESTQGQPILVQLFAADVDWLIDLAEEALQLKEH